MGNLVLNGATSGATTLTPTDAVTTTVTFPSLGGTAMVSGNMPAFSAYASANQTGISSSVPTKMNFAVEEYDTNNNFASSRFTPTVAGYYQITYRASVGAQYGIIQVYKNGSAYSEGNTVQGYTQGYDSGAQGTNLVYANGSTDYYEIYILISGGTLQCNGSAGSGITLGTCFQGAMVRSA